MEIIYQYSFETDDYPKLVGDLANIGVTALDIGRDGFFRRVQISRDSKQFNQVNALMESSKIESFLGTRYTKEDYDSSVYFQMQPDWLYGYPKPDDDRGFLSLTYNLSDYDEKCGMGAIQKAPFYLIGEPKWGKRHIFSLNWVFDEFFVKPEVYEKVFKPYGIGYWPTLRYKKGNELTTVVQLKIDRLLDGPLDIRESGFEECKTCRRKKYLPNIIGYFPKPLKHIPKGIHAVKTIEYFGSGAEARKMIIISKELYDRIQENKLKGLYFRPVKK